MQHRTASLILLILILLPAAVWAQDARGRVGGQVTDSSGAVMAGVEVAATNSANGVRVTATTNAAGLYDLPYLQPGIYTITVSASGFKSYERSDFEVRVAERLTLDIRMEVGATSESVVVTGQASLLESSTASMGQVVDARRIIDLPLPGGNALSLSRLAPGIQNLASPNHPSLGPAVEVLSSLSVNGVRGGNIEFTVDGTPAMWGTNASYAPPTDMVAEFKVQTATYDASTGRAPGGNVNVVLRTGTNKLHGALYHFHNNNKLQSLDLFQRQFLYNPSTGPVTEAKKQAANPKNILNRYGFNFNGPVYFPKLYDGRNRTFWIYGYEGLTRPGVERGNNFYTVPTLRQRQGDFSELTPLGASFQLYDPATAVSAPGGRVQRSPFPGNVIPRARLDRTALNLLQYWPEPNTQGAADGRNNFTRLTRSWNEFFSHTAKLDHNLSERHRMFVRYNQTFQLFSSGQVFENVATGNDRFRYNYGAGFDDVYTFSPSFLLNTRYGFTRFEQRFDPLAIGFDLAGAGFAPSYVNSIDPQARTFPSIQVQGMQNLGTTSPSRAVSNYHIWAGDATYMRGTHSIKFGAEFRLYREHNYNFNLGMGQLIFNNNWTRGPLDSAAGAPIGLGLASFMLGLPTDGQLNTNDSLAEQSSTTAFYLQDDWRVNSKLTLNVGVRYDYDSPITERFNRSVSGYDFSVANPIDARARANYAASPIPELPVNQFRATGGLLFAGAGGQSRSLWSGDRNNIAPRIGIAWTPRANTVIRAGYGFFYVPLGSDRQSVNQSGFTLRNALVPTLDNGLTFAASLQNPFPSGVQPPPGATGGLSTDVGRSVSFFTPAPANGYMQRFSLGVQQEFAGGWLVEASYVGNRGTKLLASRPYNAVPNSWLSTSPGRDQPRIDLLTGQVNNPFFPLPGTDLAGRTIARSQLLRPFPHYTGLSANESIGYSWYHSMQLRTERRMKSGFTVQASYTFSKLMEASGFRNGGDPFLEEVISDIDRSHRLTGSGVWELPFGKGRKWIAGAHPAVETIVGGWQLQAVYQFNSGAPIGFGNSILTDDIRNVALSGSNQTLDRWFRTEAFNRDPAQQLGQNVQGLSTRFSGLRAPGVETWDISMLKVFAIKERFRLQFRAEYLNALNRSNLAAPNTTPTNSLFGRVTATNGFPRYIHFGLRLMF